MDFPYYLNNGALFQYHGLGNTVAGGKEYSDSDGNELWNTKGFITKTATINSYNEK
jgi:hypothetical protein